MSDFELSKCNSPDQVARVLRFHAEKMREDAAELNHAHGSDSAGRPWNMIAGKLERVAASIEQGLKNLGY